MGSLGRKLILLEDLETSTMTLVLTVKTEMHGLDNLPGDFNNGPGDYQ